MWGLPAEGRGRTSRRFPSPPPRNAARGSPAGSTAGCGRPVGEARRGGPGDRRRPGRAVRPGHGSRPQPVRSRVHREARVPGGASAEGRRQYRPTRDTWGPLVVPRDKYFVLGDNRDNSLDSRYWGFVDATAVKGRPLVVYFSYDREARDAFPWLKDIRWSRLGALIR